MAGASGKRVYVAYTGGTIGMAPGLHGYAPEPGFLERQLREIPELEHPLMPEFTIHEYAPLLDSANMTPTGWLHIARDIARHYAEYDGFVVIHGTDTMAYTASALPFLLEGLAKPVIVTGSQIPLCEIRSDGRDNLITALLIAAHQAVPEVCIYFGDRLLRGNRSVKVNAVGFDAFRSPNYPPLGIAGVDIEIDWSHVLEQPESAGVHVPDIGEPVVASLRLFPGIQAKVLENILQPPLEGLVLESYGTGNGPDHDEAFLGALAAASARGVVIVNCTQCVKGRVDQQSYSTGSRLAAAGVTGGEDMTAEAALAKLYYLLGLGLPAEEVRKRMGENLRGELTPDAAA